MNHSVSLDEPQLQKLGENLGEREQVTLRFLAKNEGEPLSLNLPTPAQNLLDMGLIHRDMAIVGIEGEGTGYFSLTVAGKIVLKSLPDGADFG